MNRRVVVTGMGAITPIGLNVDEFWSGVKSQKVGIDVITKVRCFRIQGKISK